MRLVSNVCTGDGDFHDIVGHTTLFTGLNHELINN